MLGNKTKALIDEVFDTSSNTWKRRICGREKVVMLLEALKNDTGREDFGSIERCEIPEECIPKIQALV